MGFIAESASLRDLDRLYEIEIECFDKEAFTKLQIASLLKDYNSINLIAKLKSEIVGFIIGMLYFERNSLVGHILTIDVSVSYRRKGVAEKLMREIEKIFKEKGATACRLEVREDNVAALNLYKKLGYKKIARLKNYYGNVHGIYLKKNLA
ncbi:MAG TPA: ribosomal protein S18-alanine N-acetyltransferase [Acidobacteriota bacterium]|nr:ribosomal protein S18-alanine N-acetyltransferase [Acidobacteriota bacterium]